MRVLCVRICKCIGQAFPLNRVLFNAINHSGCGDSGDLIDSRCNIYNMTKL